MCRLLLSMLLVCALGCDKRDSAGRSPFEQGTCDYIVLIAIDLSGSFGELIADDGKAYDFALRVLDRYFHDRVGGNDQIIITQLSGSNPLLWQGTPRQLRQDFRTPDAFRDHLLARADPTGSRINDGLAESLDYVLGTHSVAHGNAKTIALVLSDMLDNQPDNAASEQRLLDALTRYARRGAIGFYFCDQYRLADIRKKTRDAGFEWCIIEGGFHGEPPLPSFD